MTTILEQMAKPSKQPQQISMWVDQFNRLILQQCRQGQDTKMLIDAILYQIPWFSSDNHLRSLNSFKKCISTILCAFPHYIDNIYSMLVGKLNIDSFNAMDQVQKNEIPIEILDFKFTNRSALIDEIHRILQSVNVFGEEEIDILQQKDQLLMQEIFKSHKNQMAKLNGLNKIGIGYFPSKNVTKCFYILKNDGTVEDISYVKSVDNLIENLFSQLFMKQYSQHQESFQKLIYFIAELDGLNKLHQGVLFQLLSNAFPHKSKHEFILKCYVTNLLILSDCIVNLRPKIISLIVMKLISIDSEIRLEGHNNKQRQIDLKDEMLKKLDHLIYELLDYFEKKFESGCSEQQIIDIFIELQKLFQENILKNEQSRLIHFIYLVFCGQNQFVRISQLFVTRLILNIKDESISRRQRINSVFYLCSLILHCKGLSQQLIIRTLDIIVEIGNEQIYKFLQTNQQLTHQEILYQNEIHLHIVQMLAIIVSYGFIQQQILEFLLNSHSNIFALSFLNTEILIKLNDRLLHQSIASQNITKLIDITAQLISEKRPSSLSQSPNLISTPMLYDESCNSRLSNYTTNHKFRKNQLQNNILDNVKPFQFVPFLVSEATVKKYFISDTEIPSIIKQWQIIEPQNNLKRKSKDLNISKHEQIIKKIK